ncbi:DUF2834 domain-containing protein [Paucibacter sp. PLA-PC-4]|uniref:DUF2834 domain-containing protein n=1 Tax=Paucibacter sp. PLA-PC-4 TaxID=2993655 RepID=UPI002249A08C|nr:DUF2834 domain-containing protein [Paucibacter sp. PLA-PC-4]MCX2862414.1 DUF2834 domain-containing protein [Paucibacter sp. PLA-PC-4]
MKVALALVFAVFGAYSLYVIAELGYLGLWQALLSNLAGRQVVLDLLIASVLLLGFLWRDAQRSRRRFWPYVLLTLAAGSFGPLLYLLLAPRADKLSAGLPRAA